uniref:hypothetical protein n=1 Tax=Chroococcidiopsis cubana TaxID=171392 RepID=UPI002159053B|nr:hypothetical protein [Chroococcidiopsis cubana]
MTIPTQGACSPETLMQILIRAASKQDSIEHTTQRLQGVPSGNTIRYHLDKLNHMQSLEAQLNQTLQSRVPPRIAKGKQRLAIDLHLLPYYGTPSEIEQPYIYRAQAKAGTTKFFAYATVYVIARNKRVTLAVHAVHRQETLFGNPDLSARRPGSPALTHQAFVSGAWLFQCSRDSLAQGAQLAVCHASYCPR